MRRQPKVITPEIIPAAANPKFITPTNLPAPKNEKVIRPIIAPPTATDKVRLVPVGTTDPLAGSVVSRAAATRAARLSKGNLIIREI